VTIAAVTPEPDPQGFVRFFSLAVGLGIALAGTIYPPLFIGSKGTVDHGMMVALFWAMSAGLVRGVGFVPRKNVWKWVFSGWSCIAGLLVASGFRWTV